MPGSSIGKGSKLEPLSDDSCPTCGNNCGNLSSGECNLDLDLDIEPDDISPGAVPLVTANDDTSDQWTSYEGFSK